MHPRSAVLSVDDPSRRHFRRAVFATLWLAASFLVFTATKEVKPIYDHAPWLNDLYDTAIPFTMFFVLLVAVCLLVRVSLCRKSAPIPAAQVHAILRACLVVVGAVAVD